MNVKFIKSVAKQEDWIKDTKKEICFVGRSNVGKSTLINVLANKKVAKTSNTPGRTQLINFFDFGSFRLVDLPGYGYAKISKAKRNEISSMIEEYLLKRKNLVAVFQICDCNVLTDNDIQLANILKQKFSNFFVLLNKADKQNNSFFDNNKHKISQYLNVDTSLMIPISCKTKLNINKLNKIILDFLK